MIAHQEQMVLKPMCLFSQGGEIGERERDSRMEGKREESKYIEVMAGEKKDRWVNRGEREVTRNGLERARRRITERARREGGKLKGGDFYSEESYKSLTSLQGEGEIVHRVCPRLFYRGGDRDERFDSERKERVSFPSLLARLLFCEFSLSPFHFLYFLSSCMRVCV